MRADLLCSTRHRRAAKRFPAFVQQFGPIIRPCPEATSVPDPRSILSLIHSPRQVDWSRYWKCPLHELMEEVEWGRSRAVVSATETGGHHGISSSMVVYLWHKEDVVLMITFQLFILQTIFSLVAARCPFLDRRDDLYWGFPEPPGRLPGTDQPYPVSALQSSVSLVVILVRRLLTPRTC